MWKRLQFDYENLRVGILSYEENANEQLEGNEVGTTRIFIKKILEV